MGDLTLIRDPQDPGSPTDVDIRLYSASALSDSRPSRCISCGHERTTRALTFRRPGEDEHWVLQCVRCSHHFLDGWEQSYDVGAYDYYRSRAGLQREDLYDDLTTSRLQAILGRLRRSVVADKVLDVGCGEGQLVLAGREMGLDARGIDVSEPAIEVCQAHGLPCRVTDLFSPELDGERFDIITLVETIEHVPHPVAFLDRTRTLLAPGGVVWLTTPNFYSLGKRILGGKWAVLAPEHLSYFTPGSLEHVSHTAGYRDTTIRSRTISAAAVRSLLRRPTPVATPGEAGAAISDGFAAEQRLRHRIESTAALRLAKHAVNAALSATRLGETLTAELRVGQRP